jgi:hypothetical protein
MAWIAARSVSADFAKLAVVNEAEVDDAVGRRGTAPETVQIGQVAPLHLGASSRDCRRRCV